MGSYTWIVPIGESAALAMSTIKRSSLTMQQRLNILQDLETLSTRIVAAKYQVDPTTVRRIKRNAASISDIARMKQNIDRKRVRRPKYEQVEEELFAWFIQRRAVGDNPSDALLLKKAAEIKDTIGCCNDFKVSMGWLTNFKLRHNIRLLRMPCEKLTVDKDAATEFINKFQTLMEEENINLQNIYIMDESGLLWKALPTKLMRNDERCASGYKRKKERSTIALCANATGTHKLDPLLIYRYKKPRALKNYMNKLAIVFKSQSNVGMNENLFIDWYNNHFKPSVRKHQLENGLCGKTILLLDDCARNKIPNDEDEHFKIVYIPANTTTLIHPMNQGIMQKVKRYFRHKLMKKAISHEQGIQEFYEHYNIKDCIDILSESWADITTSDVKNAWSKLILEYADELREEEENVLLDDLQVAMSTISERNVSREDVTQFLEERLQEERNFIEETKQEQEEDGEEEEETEEEEEVEVRNGNTDIEINNEIKTEMDGGPKDHGITLNSEERKEVEDIFRRLEHFNLRVPLSTKLQLESLKLVYLGEP